MLVQQRERERQRLLASVAGGLGPSVLNYIANFISGNRWVRRSFERERRLAADKGIGRPTLAIEYETVAGEVVESVKVKVKFTLEQATKAHRGSRSIALFFL